MRANRKTSIIGIIVTIVVLIVIVVISNIKAQNISHVEGTFRKTCYSCTKWVNILKKLDFRK